MISLCQPASPRRRPLVLVVLGLILAAALAVRLAYLDWDQGFLFHPDERQIMFVVSNLAFPWPPDWGLLLSPASPWNPAFFAYGSLPLYLLRIVANLAALIWPEMALAQSFYLLGRGISALADVGSVLLVYLLGRELYDDAVGLLGAALVACTVLHVQLAHFYTVDTLLTFFVLLALLLALRAVRRPTWGRWAGVGVAVGAALATKISAAPLVASVAVACLAAAWGQGEHGRAVLWRALRYAGMAGITALVTFGICQPYALLDLGKFLADVLQESQMARGIIDMPYTRQFAGTKPYLYPLQQTVLWSMGLPLGVVGLAGALAALAQAVLQALRRHWAPLALGGIPLIWFVAYLGLTGGFYAKFLRYMLPVIPLLCLWGAASLVALVRARRRWLRYAGASLAIVTLLASALYTLAYLHVFSATHPWIQATEWLCSQVPAGRTLLIEHWDNPLPIPQGRGKLNCWSRFRYITFEAYYPDDAAKLNDLLDALQASDYIVLSSNRLYNSIPRLPERYPLTMRYYELLMAEELGFELVYFAQVYPELGGVRLVDDTFHDPDLPMPRLLAEEGRRSTDIVLGRADESYSVYDHPMPLIFAKTAQLPREELLARFGPVIAQLPASSEP